MATSTLTASSAAAIVVYLEPTMGSMRTRLNVPFVAMCMEQMGPTCTKDDVPSAKGEPRGYSTGRKAEIIDENCIEQRQAE
ncbi:MAG: hypothetical protein JRE47_10910 [Deltaproteobacteria bacterium]|nr:hypothetical protein [Deltaproteobacteria bacterium]